MRPRRVGAAVRRLVVWVFLLSLLSPTGTSPAAEKVKFGLSWIPYGLFVGFFGALGEGFYKAEGIDVEWLRGFGMADATKKVAAGSLDFASADIANAALGRARGLAVKSVALLIGNPPYAVAALKEAGIRKPRDLEGRSIITSPKDILDQTFPIFARTNGIKSWKWVYVNPPAKNPSLLAGKGDAMTFFVVGYPILKRMAAQVGKEVVLLKWSDFGFEALSDAVLATEGTLRAKPDLVRRFVRATLLGYAWSLENPRKATDHFLRFKPEAIRDVELEQWLITGDLIMTPFVKAQGLGRHDPAMVTKTRDLIFGINGIQKAVPAGDIYTEQFLPKEKIVPRFRR